MHLKHWPGSYEMQIENILRPLRELATIRINAMSAKCKMQPRTIEQMNKKFTLQKKKRKESRNSMKSKQNQNQNR